MIPETAVFTETVNFQEVGINEPVLGGLSPEGPINRIARILGSRTLWLRNLILQVQDQGWIFSAFSGVSTSTTITSTEKGSVIEITGSSSVLMTLPDPAVDLWDNGDTVTLKNNNTNTTGGAVSVRVHPGSSETFDNGNTSLILRQGDSVCLVYKGINTWAILFNTRTKDRVGCVEAFAGSGAPPGYSLCNGAAVSRVTYRWLFAVIGVTYGEGDGSTTFDLPDLRGEFIRGLDAGRGVDTSRTLGSAQSDLFKAHTHTVEGSADVLASYDSGLDAFIPGGAAVTTSSSGGSETRPRNVAMNYIIYHGVF